LRGCAFFMAALTASAFAAGVAGAGGRPVLAASSAGVSQEIALDGLAIGAQTVHGPHGLAEASFPPPAAAIAPGGCFVRVFFAHSQQAAAGSVMVISMNGQPLTSVELTRGNAPGGVLEVRVPSSVIDQQRGNRLQVRFDLVAPSVSQELLYGRVDSRTLIHYNLAPGANGQAGLETYPFSLLATDASRPGNPTLGVALPTPPDPTETAAALGILTEVGRRAATQRVRVRVMSAADLSAPDTQGAGVLLVGRMDRLPAAERALSAAGWHSTPDGWMAPEGEVARAADGILLMATSPWDGHTPMLLVTGATDQALARAAALASSEAPLAGTSAIASSEPRPVGALNRSPQLTGSDAALLASIGSSEYLSELSFIAPAVARHDTVALTVTLPALATSANTQVAIAINGNQVLTASFRLDASRPQSLRADFPGNLLRQGRNSLSLSLRGLVGAQPDAVGSVTAALSLPGEPRHVADLGVLPYPFLADSSQGTRFVLADTSPATLTAAAETAVVLGHRAAGPAPPPDVALAADSTSVAGSANLIVVGQPGGTAQLQRLAAGLPPVATGAGQVAETRSAQRTILWLAGSGETALSRAVNILYDPRLIGQLAAVDASGKVSIGSIGGESGSSAAQPVTGPDGSGVPAVLMLIAAVAVVLVSLAVIQLLRAQRVSG
jgi:hypothetical protein